MVLAASFVLFGNIEFVAGITNFGTFITFASVNLSAIWLRYRKPECKRPFKTPVTIGKLPLIPLLGLLSCGLMVTQFQTEVIALSTFILFIGIITQRILTKTQAKNGKES